MPAGERATDGRRSAGRTAVLLALATLLVYNLNGRVIADATSLEQSETLAAVADVVIENFRPGTLEKWGLGDATLLGGVAMA